MQSYKRLISLVIISSQLLIFFIATPPVLASGSSDIAQLGGKANDPLLIKVQGNGLIGVFAKNEFSLDDAYQARYFDDFCSSSVLFFKLADQDYQVYGKLYKIFSNPPADDYSIELTAGEHDLTQANQIITSWDLPGLLQLKQIISYETGSWLIKKTFQITAGAELSDLRFVHEVDLELSGTLQVSSDESGILGQEQSFPNFWQVKFSPREIASQADYLSYGDSITWDQEQTGDPNYNPGSAKYITVLASWAQDSLAAGDEWSASTYEDYAPASAPAGPGQTEASEPAPSPTVGATSQKDPTEATEPTVTPTPRPVKETSTTSEPKGSSAPSGSVSSETTGTVAESRILEPTKDPSVTSMETGVGEPALSSTGPTIIKSSQLESRVGNTGERSDPSQTSASRPTKSQAGSDQADEFVKTGEYYATTFAFLLLLAGVFLLITRIKLAKRSD